MSQDRHLKSINIEEEISIVDEKNKLMEDTKIQIAKIAADAEKMNTQLIICHSIASLPMFIHYINDNC